MSISIVLVISIILIAIYFERRNRKILSPEEQSALKELNKARFLITSRQTLIFVTTLVVSLLLLNYFEFSRTWKDAFFLVVLILFLFGTKYMQLLRMTPKSDTITSYIQRELIVDTCFFPILVLIFYLSLEA